MKIVTSVTDMINMAMTCRAAGDTIALIPTMGALHKGHLSLLDNAKEHASKVVMSIFVNPTQFGPNEDYGTYPRTFDDDCKKADEAGCDIVFAPTVNQMYPEGYKTSVVVRDITQRLCGAYRPTHFEGVTTIVLKLLNVVQPHVAVFGAKDAQQVIVIKRMIADLNHPTKIIVRSTIREDDGLALSSRNSCLTTTERNEAPLIYRGLYRVKSLFDEGERSCEVLLEKLNEELAKGSSIAPQYTEIVDYTTLEPLQTVASAALVAVACHMNQSGTRLIDNICLGDTL